MPVADPPGVERCRAGERRAVGLQQKLNFTSLDGLGKNAAEDQQSQKTGCPIQRSLQLQIPVVLRV
jgi:hypothetical protein